MDLSIVIVNYNNSKLLKENLQSIYDSTHKTSLDIIVVDNASADDSIEMMRNNFPDVKIIANKENLGFIKASNQGLDVSKGRYAMLLNDDTIVKEGAFDTLVKFMDSNSSAGACGPKLLNTDGTLQRQGSLTGPAFWKATEPKEVDFIMGACLIVRREVLEKVGNLDENLFFYNDDLDWCKRIKNAGWKIFFVPQAEVIHYGGYSTRRSFNKRMFVEGFRGGLYFCKKHYGSAAFQVYRILLIAFFPLALAGLTVSSAFRGFREYREKLEAYFRILKIALVGPIEYPWKP